MAHTPFFHISHDLCFTDKSPHRVFLPLSSVRGCLTPENLIYPTIPTNIKVSPEGTDWQQWMARNPASAAGSASLHFFERPRAWLWPQLQLSPESLSRHLSSFVPIFVSLPSAFPGNRRPLYFGKCWEGDKHFRHGLRFKTVGSNQRILKIQRRQVWKWKLFCFQDFLDCRLIISTTSGFIGALQKSFFGEYFGYINTLLINTSQSTDYRDMRDKRNP